MVIAAQMPSLEQIFFLVQLTADEPKTSIIFNLSKCDAFLQKAHPKKHLHPYGTFGPSYLRDGSPYRGVAGMLAIEVVVLDNSKGIARQGNDMFYMVQLKIETLWIWRFLKLEIYIIFLSNNKKHMLNFGV